MKTSRMLGIALGVCLLTGPVDARAGDDLLKDEITPFTQAVAQQLRDKQFNQLEQLETELRTSKARFTGGDWKLFRYYRALGGDYIPTGVGIERDWLELIEHLTAWKTASPQSGAASLALAQAYTGYAWFARGSGPGEGVRQQQFDVFKDRLNQAGFYLNESRRYLPNNPHWYATSLLIALGLGWDVDRAQTLFAQAMSIEPLYQHTYSQMATFLLPRWHGEPGDWERFAEEATARVEGPAGSAIYNHIIVVVANVHGSVEFFSENNVRWRRIEWSFADREKLYGADRQAMNAMCRLAGGADDRTAARSYLQRIGDSWDQWVWKRRQDFDAYQKWVLTD